MYELKAVHSTKCNEMSRKIWDFALELSVWLSIVHIPEVENVEADEASRMFNDETE